VGACAGNTGEIACSDGVTDDTCDPYQGAAADDTTCDSIDDDCDGSTDEEYVPVPTVCGVGACAGNTGEIACSDGVTDDTCDPFQGAANESESNGNCSDSTDNDCDGLTDGDDPSCGVIANTPPIAAFYVAPPTGTTATLFQADADASTDLEDDDLSLTFLWDWDGDGVTDDEGETSSHTFASEGAYTVTLIVEDTGLLRGYATFEVIVAPTDELIMVTTQLDEQDVGATPASPGGTGLSLREAIIYANGRAGKQTVFVPSGYVIGIVDTLPNSTDVSGLDVVADGAALDGSGTNPNEACVQLNTSDARFYGLEIFNCGGVGVQFIGGSNNRVARCYIHDNEVGVYMSGSGNFFGPDNEVTGNVNMGVHVAGANTVEFNQVHGNPARGIFLGGGAAGSTVRGNTVYQNGTDGIFVANQADDSVVVHNTVHDNTSSGVYIGGSASGIDFRNNILSQNGAWGVFADDDNFLYRDYNNYYLNASGTCAWCSTAEPNSLSDEPLYIDAAGHDFRLRDDSPLIDQGAILGIDVNRAEPGDYNGSGPDIGAWEAP
jgi:parallel beta-helix repeat protein